MRHRNSGRKLGRTSAHRKAMFRNMASALLIYGRITTTEAKAKEIRGVVEPLITLAKKDDLHARREAYRVLCNHKLVKRLFDEIGPEFKEIKGGYTRVVKLALPRKGDGAVMAVVELIKGKHTLHPEEAKTSDKAAKSTEAAPAEAGETKGRKAAVKAAPKAAKPKVAPKSAAPKASKVTSTKPKSTPRKMEG